MNSNRNPEQIRLDENFREQERLTWEAAHGKLEQLPPREMDNKTRAAALRKLLDRMYPDKSDDYKLERLREIWGTGKKPAKKTAPVPVKKPNSAPIRKDSSADKEALKKWLEDMNAYNVSRAAQFGIKNPGEVQYR